MIEITSITLENEMDLILAHKQSMRIAELTGLSLAAQTTFATAVSEVSRNAIGNSGNPCLKLFVSEKREKVKFITAVLEYGTSEQQVQMDEGYSYAKKLVSSISVRPSENGSKVEIQYRLPATTRIDDVMVEKWRIHLNTDPAISPYEEIKRKNRQLSEMAARLQESELQYKTLTDSLPIMIFSLTQAGDIIYSNHWLLEYSGQSIAEINRTRWKQIVHPDDFEDIWSNWQQQASDTGMVIAPERRLKNAATGEYRWHTGVATPIVDTDGTVKVWNTFMVDIHAQKMVEQTLKDNIQLKELHTELEEKVRLLNQSNQQLEQFAYIASHDLQEPLRKIAFYSDFLETKYGDKLPAEANVFFHNLLNATGRMKILVQDILAYSTVRKEGFTDLDLNSIARDTLEDLEITIREKRATLVIDPLPTIKGNARQVKQLFENIVSNSLKFARENTPPHIHIYATATQDHTVVHFSDEGIGFDNKYVDRMFDLFRRLHGKDKYTGTGIGLAICKKIAEMHNGSIAAHGEPGKGATFSVSIPMEQK